MYLVLRGNSDQATLVEDVRRQVAMLDREVPVYGVTRMDDVVSDSVARQRFELFLLALFAAVALVMATVGVYGLLSFSAGRRTHEIGLRIALGAHPWRVLALVLTQGMKLVALGLGVGIVASLFLMHLMTELLYQVSPGDPLTLAVVTIALAATGALACWVPARRAMQVDPMVALRSE